MSSFARSSILGVKIRALPYLGYGDLSMRCLFDPNGIFV